MGSAMSWDLISDGRKKPRKPLKVGMEFEVTAKTKLKTYTKNDLVEEVYRLQTTIRELAVIFGVARNAKSSEYTIDPHFVPNAMVILKAAQTRNL